MKITHFKIKKYLLLTFDNLRGPKIEHYFLIVMNKKTDFIKSHVLTILTISSLASTPQKHFNLLAI